jgi:hypothetical protein
MPWQIIPQQLWDIWKYYKLKYITDPGVRVGLQAGRFCCLNLYKAGLWLKKRNCHKQKQDEMNKNEKGKISIEL